MWDELRRWGYLYQHDAVAGVSKFGDDLVGANTGSTPMIERSVLRQFKMLQEQTKAHRVECDKHERRWDFH
jgi:hypothetical protein